ncbi:hypothetical protein BGX33_002532 [Mortierella sp. NVP41]|nr:hypothetical protein BGX33_002532 [Mortierella sp. NVP41]
MSVPTFTNACIAPSSSGSNVYIAGVSTAGSLSVYSVNLANVNSPISTLLATNTDVSWLVGAKKSCVSFPGLQGTTNAPFVVQQFGVRTSQQLQVYPNGTTLGPLSFSSTSFVNPQLYNIAGASKDYVWYTAASNNTNNSNGPWVGMRLNATSPYYTLSDPVLTNYPPATALVSVGTYIPTTYTPAQGYTVVFDLLGGGSIYTALDTAVLITGSDRIISLASPRPVDMGDIKLTSNAIPINMAPDGTTVLYSIDPSQSNKLQRVAIPGNAPRFSPNMIATTIGSQIVTYGSVSGSTAFSPFNIFDTIVATWSGPGLVKPSPLTPPSTATPSPTGNVQPIPFEEKAPIGAIVGGVVGGLVVIALAAFLFIRYRRKNKEEEAAAAAAAAAAPTSAYNEQPKNNNNTTTNNNTVAPPMNQLNALPQPPPQQQQPGGFDPRQSYYSQPPQSPTIFQAQPEYSPGQKPYNYSPPIYNPNAQQQPQQPQPTIFQPQSSAAGNQMMYSPTQSSVHTMGPYSPVASQAQSNTPGTPHFGTAYP